jgi:hypothetical protein
MLPRTLAVVLVLAAAAGCALTGSTTTAAKADMAVLALTVNVKGAEVYIDDALFGQIASAGRPQEFVVPGGKHALVVKKDGFAEQKFSIGVEIGGVNTLEVVLKRTPAEIVTLREEAPSDRAAEAKQAKTEK